MLIVVKIILTGSMFQITAFLKSLLNISNFCQKSRFPTPRFFFSIGLSNPEFLSMEAEILDPGSLYTHLPLWLD